jgi:hypothetical protein
MKLWPSESIERELPVPPEAAAARLTPHVDRFRLLRSLRFSSAQTSP